MKPIVIDVHAHYTPALLFERFEARAGEFPHVKLARGDKGAQLTFPGDDAPRAVMPQLTDLDSRRTWMDSNGIDHQLVGGWVEGYGYDLPAAEGLAWSRLQNDCMRDALAQETRFTPLATVPLQDGRLAAEVLGQVMAAGFAGVMIGTLPKGAAGDNLDDASLDPFWDAASQLGAAVYLHPQAFCGQPRLDDYRLDNAIGRLEDTSIAVARLLYSGHLTRFANLKLVLSHGGGTLPYALGRLARGHENLKGKAADPHAGFAAMYFDSCVFDVDALRYLARKAGTGRVMLGSDAPFPMGDPAPRKIVDGAGFSAAEKDEILTRTAQQVFRVRPDCFLRHS
jgi:aminocarboxymuconate-semialdehyde decarboxylase